MPEIQESFKRAVADILEVVMFENWLRFYFIREAAIQDKQQATEDKGPGREELRIELPKKSLERIKTLYPHLFSMADAINCKPVDFETSRRLVLTYVLDKLDGKTMPKDMAQTVFSSTTFQVQLQLFNTWAQVHEEQLDQDFIDFGTWKALFEQWRNGKSAKELAVKLAANPQPI